MNIKINKIDGTYDGKKCYVHPRACAIDEKNRILTLQYLDVTGCDLFEPLCVMKTSDGGKTWSEPMPDDAFFEEQITASVRRVACDASHIYHNKTGSPVIIGLYAHYCGKELETEIVHESFYSVYTKNGYKPVKLLEKPDESNIAGFHAGCIQAVEEDNGDILIPVYITEKDVVPIKVRVLRYGFDGETLTLKEMGKDLLCDVERGFCEPSLCKFKGKYYLTLRNDQDAYCAVSDDGLNFYNVKKWTWDTGDIIASYNTQQHWLICGGKLHLVYTRKAGNNDHVFRHRAPLFIAEVDTETMSILRHTEKIAVPERGARLGNFGVTYVNENLSLVTVSEWMQPEGCEKFGSDNSIYITEVTPD